ncbi:MAG: ABC transporter permease [Clostridium sp.]
MNTKLFNIGLIKYEIRNLIGNVFTVVFGLFFPIGMSILMGNTVGTKVPEAGREVVITGIFITISLIIPLATVLVGYSATFSQELENQVPLRLTLFGYKESALIISKISASLIFMTISLIFYTIVNYIVFKLPMPTVGSAIILITSLYSLAIALFILAHGVALFFKKFGPTYAITMGLYFIIMILSGLLGVQVKDLPILIRSIAYMLPTSYINSDFTSFWTGGSYNFVPFIQSFIFLMAISCIVLFLALNKNSRRIKSRV